MKPTSRIAFATTATAALALLLIVPTILHLADPAFGTGVGAQGGYGKGKPDGLPRGPPDETPPNPPRGDPHVTTSDVGDLAAGQARTIPLPAAARIVSVTLTSPADAQGVALSVHEFAPTSDAQTFVTTLADADAAHVAVRATDGATYHALSLLDVAPTNAPGASGVIRFVVTEDELTRAGLASADVVLLHLEKGKWVPLPTTLVARSDDAFTFEAATPSFSPFAIAGATTSAPPGLAAAPALGLAAAALGVVALAVIVVARRR